MGLLPKQLFQAPTPCALHAVRARKAAKMTIGWNTTGRLGKRTDWAVPAHLFHRPGHEGPVVNCEGGSIEPLGAGTLLPVNPPFTLSYGHSFCRCRIPCRESTSRAK